MIVDVLIAFYQKNECLWNHNTPEYHQVRHKELLYDILVKELDEKYDVGGIKKKWKQLLKHFREEHAKTSIKVSLKILSLQASSLKFYEQLQFVTVVCDDTDETTDSLTSEPKPKSRKLSKQLQKAREEKKLELFSEAVRAINEPNSVLKDEVAADCNYIRLTLSKFSASNFRRAKKCIGDILFQIEDNGEVDTRITPHIAYSRDRYSPTPSS
ncbi:unnamed protein product, partial [Porites lobata]